MNQSGRIFAFVLFSFLSLVTLSLFGNSLFEKMGIKNIDLFSDIKPAPKKHKATETKAEHPALVTTNTGIHAFQFDAYERSQKIIDYSVDSNAAALPRFVQKLAALKGGQKKKVRIAFIGDSMIEGDLITGDMRKTLQQIFGGKGVGFIPVTNIAAASRSTAIHTFSNDWTDICFKNPSVTIPFFLSGHAFTSSGDSWFAVTDKTVVDSVNTYLLYGKGSGNIICNDQSFHANNTQPFNTQQLVTAKSLKLKVTDASLPLYGVSFESEDGVIIDNFSYRGITGIELKKLDSSLLQQVAQLHNYDLIILGYGLNVLDDDRDTHFKWYDKQFSQSVVKLKSYLPQTDILLLSCGDRAFRKDNEYATGEHVPNLVETQAGIAYNAGIAFFNLYTSMGGEGSMVNWVTATPSLAYKDYMHPNERGSAKIATFLTDAIIEEVNKVKR